MAEKKEVFFERPTIGDGRNKLSRLTVWSFVDQGVVSLGNFATQLILARSLTPKDYGSFALFYGLILILNVCHLCFVSYPLSLAGTPATTQRLRNITVAALSKTGLLNIVFIIPVCAAAGFMHRKQLIIWVFCALFTGQIQETLRRALMAHSRFFEVVWGDAISYVVQAGMVGLLVIWNRGTLEHVFQIMAITSMLGGLLQYMQLGSGYFDKAESMALFRVSIREGRWAFLASFSNVITSAALPWILAVRGVSEAAAYQAAANLLSFVNPIASSSGNLILPTVANTHEVVRLRLKRAREIGARGGALLLLPFALALVEPRFCLVLMYGRSSVYTSMSLAVQILSLAFAAAYIGHVQMFILYGLGMGNAALRGQIIGTAGLLLAVPLALWFGVVGAAGGLLLVNLLRIIGNAIQFSSISEDSTTSPNHSLCCEER